MNKLIIGLMASAAIAFPGLAQQTQEPQQDQMQRTQPAPGQNETGQQEISPGQLSSDEIRQVQQALKEKGFNAGEVDGVWGPSTASAVRQFQQTQGMQADGRLNEQTLSALGVTGAGKQPDTRVAPGAPPSGQPESESPDNQAPGAAPQQPNPGTDQGPSGPTR